jgi:vancomycin permeability regulator SanA
MNRFVHLVLLSMISACSPKYVLHAMPNHAFDAVVVLGCPSEMNGAPSRCQIERAGEAAYLWKHGASKNFIVSGAAVHSPYVEAEALAQIMETLGVPSERIFLERNALHTDENILYAIGIANEQHFDNLAVTSQEWHADLGCRMMVSRGRTCSAFGTHARDLAELLPQNDSKVAELRAPRVDPWRPLKERKGEEHSESGDERPPSYVLYTMLSFGLQWNPHKDALLPALTWRERSAELGISHD